MNGKRWQLSVLLSIRDVPINQGIKSFMLNRVIDPKVWRNGRVIRRFIGFNPDTTPTQLREALELALKDEG